MSVGMVTSRPVGEGDLQPGRRRILVADDSPLVRRTVRRLLEADAVEVHEAASGEEAFELCLRHGFDALITDVTMGALSGFQLCRLLRTDPLTAEMPILLLTASDDARSRFWGRHAGADGYLSKQAVSEHLRPMLDDALRERGAGGHPSAARRDAVPRPMERLAQVLDRLLFEAVLQGEIRRRLEGAHNRRAFAKAVIGLTSQVMEYGYLVLKLDGPGGPSFAVHARGPWPARADSTALAQLGIPPDLPTRPDLYVDEGNRVASDRIESGEMAHFPIRHSGNHLGEIALFAGPDRLASHDQDTLDIIVGSLGLITQSLFLWESTRRMAQTDELTGLANRRAASAIIERELRVNGGRPGCLAVLMCDIDHFKRVNDGHGHAAGDRVLQAVARTLQGSVRQTDSVGRWGGEEFLVVLPGSSQPGARVVAERLRRAVEEMAPTSGGLPRITLSVGGAALRQGDSAESLVDRADQALYRAKERGRNRVELSRK